MKLVVASDIHGSAAWCSRLMGAVERESPDLVVLLGDLLYHGPRNALPEGYAPQEVAAMLNGIAGRVLAVRGNCDAEVDQWMLDFPCMGDYAQLADESGRLLFCTHGHVYGPGVDGSADRTPPMPDGSALLFGHTHRKANGPCPGRPGVWMCNPGSVSLPKDGSHSYAVYEGGRFELRLLEEPEEQGAPEP